MLQIPGNPLEDATLAAYREFLERRASRFSEEYKRIVGAYGSLRSYAALHASLGIHKTRRADGAFSWRLREYMPNAEALWLTTDRLNFQRHAAYRFRRLENGIFQLTLPENVLAHGTYMELRVTPRSQGSGQGALRRVPAFASWVEQDAVLPAQWCARLWAPEKPYRFRHSRPAKTVFPRIYEAHVGMAQSALARQERSVGSYRDFTADILPRIKAAGYTAVQLMGILEHPLYRSYGYQVSSYFAPSSRFGTPDEFRELVDAAHGLSLMVILDIPHGHACANTEQGIAA
ncbi:MAG: 1,4-alpha-glucan branching protein, partial [Desulfovibrio sp.]|nr:1,4-alpha-glucan branching protein [Desulfovibrio sp.]